MTRRPLPQYYHFVVSLALLVMLHTRETARGTTRRAMSVRVLLDALFDSTATLEAKKRKFCSWVKGDCLFSLGTLQWSFFEQRRRSCLAVPYAVPITGLPSKSGLALYYIPFSVSFSFVHA